MTPIRLSDLPAHNITALRDSPAPRQLRKYGNKPTTIDGLRFDSRAEANRWLALRMLERAGEIRDLRRQVRYVLVPKQARPSGGIEREAAYVADFVYVDAATERTIVEDVKGAAPDVWVLKRKLMLHVHGIEVLEVKA